MSGSARLLLIPFASAFQLPALSFSATYVGPSGHRHRDFYRLRHNTPDGKVISLRRSSHRNPSFRPCIAALPLTTSAAEPSENAAPKLGYSRPDPSVVQVLSAGGSASVRWRRFRSSTAQEESAVLRRPLDSISSSLR
ncbi:hypothetical protein NDU88_004256 [Pleurodeles waltl]|uniref:Secreted protein n=1 Tax=Pleurodeles waltl TaxID=8319 RepID=A0AAV7NJ19_PLEWA|nr:hypothetical protein NDU88_004256 [Pleurodeles waltl]